MQTMFASDKNTPGLSSALLLSPAETPADTELALLRGRRVVIVEDEGITQMQLHKILKHQGMEIAGAAMSGPEGVEIARQTEPDLILMDIYMPGEFDGMEAARRILAERRVCLIIMTAFSEGLYREQASAIGVCGYVTKPIDRDTLFRQLAAAYRAFQQA